MDWIQIFVLVLGNAAWTIPMWLWARAESRADTRMMLGIIEGIKDEIKDFHGRLERQDAEFKGKLALQDAEFKAHLMHYHGKQ